MPQAVVIVAANKKGGAGKTTTILTLAGEYAAQGYRVHILDADPSLRAWKWGMDEKDNRRKTVPENITLSVANATNMRAAIEEATKIADVVLIDVEGTPNAALTFAVAYANAVIIPAKISTPDVEDGLVTMQLVIDMAHAARRTIPYGFLWSEVPSAIRSREMMNVERQITEAKIPVLGRLFQRAAFAALYSFCTTLDELPASEVTGIDKAKGDVIRLTDALDMLMGEVPAKMSDSADSSAEAVP